MPPGGCAPATSTRPANSHARVLVAARRARYSQAAQPMPQRERAELCRHCHRRAHRRARGGRSERHQQPARRSDAARHRGRRRAGAAAAASTRSRRQTPMRIFGLPIPFTGEKQKALNSVPDGTRRLVSDHPRAVRRRLAAQHGDQYRHRGVVSCRLRLQDADRARHRQAARQARREGRQRHLVGDDQSGIFAGAAPAERLPDAQPILGMLGAVEAVARQHLRSEGARQPQRRHRAARARSDAGAAAGVRRRRGVLSPEQRQPRRHRRRSSCRRARSSTTG